VKDGGGAFVLVTRADLFIDELLAQGIAPPSTALRDASAG